MRQIQTDYREIDRMTIDRRTRLD